MDRLSTKGQMVDQIDLRNVPHSGFDRSNHNYGTGRLGAIIPTRLDEVYPGDRIKGRPEVVANFEPLVAPLMGSMVLKQESFFIPYIQLWRHAWKFFTGKNGFAEQMPSISPYDIWDCYVTHLHDNVFIDIGAHIQFDGSPFADVISGLNAFYSAISGGDGSETYSQVDGYTILERIVTISLPSLYGTFVGLYDSRKMLDLVLPAYEIFNRFAKSEYLKEVSKVFEDNTVSDANKDLKVKTLFEFALALAGLFEEYFNFFHGPSSLFDYLGWPLPLYKDPKYEYTVRGVTTHNVFEYVVFWNIVTLGSKTMRVELDKLFSKVPLSFMPFKAYYLVWYWNYRDQLLETGILDPDEDEFLGSSITENVILYCTLMRQRCWFKDAFTTALTNTGDGNLLVPTGTVDDDSNLYEYYDIDGQLINTKDAAAAVKAGAAVCKIQSGNIMYNVPMNYLTSAAQATGSTLSSESQYLSLDLFDRIKRLRSFVQKRLILGYEVDDVVYSSFMVKMSNVRMHVPELLGQGRDAVQINTVVNNTSTTEQVAGDRTALAYAHGIQKEMNYFSEDWGLTLSFMTIMPIQSYAGSMQRLYLKRDPLDFMWPEFATMGMDAVYNCELAALGSRLTDEEGLRVFGYQGRYFDLKFRQDEEHGRLLTDLNYLTFSREWTHDNPPKLNYVFVHCWPRLDGFVIDNPLTDVFRYDCYNAHAWERRLPVPSEYVG